MQLLLYQGVIKQYYQHTKNTKVLKGKLEFARQLHRNLIHKERFYTTHQVYEKDHLIHQILGQALQIVEKCSKGTYLYSSCKSVQLDFPEVKAIKINQTTFRNIPNNRKTKPYETALKIARLILLNYAPDISSGKEKMLALLFDMNILWEEYVLVQLKKYCLEYRQDIVIIGQATKSFIDSNRLRPDIVIKCKEKTLIIDTKWKLPKNDVASTADMRQMYAYLRFWQAEKGILLYPGKNKDTQFEDFKNSEYDSSIHQCKIGFISVLDSDNRLDKEIGEKFLSLLGLI
jgi:5-methylcytosine-specific restriction enzyme subunit McrC